ncbi:hypothetical protein K0M31_010397 [Melipona bicolor]|uniref:Uncharacterized protein n=1 Tax=Melipona bicolor TaxID=60889 RepID=A0AA40FM26_9HYME|nr:hypothetical protein K0M31_010397 [Melipona bicolor]
MVARFPWRGEQVGEPRFIGHPRGSWVAHLSRVAIPLFGVSLCLLLLAAAAAAAAAGCHRLLPRGSKVVATASSWPRPEEKKATEQESERQEMLRQRGKVQEAGKKTRINLCTCVNERLLMIHLLQRTDKHLANFAKSIASR